jgi:hypothetical protein
MTTTPSESQAGPAESQANPPDAQANQTPPAGPAMSEVIVMDDHIYLPLDAAGDVLPDWAVTGIATEKVMRGTRLRMPDDLALQLNEHRKRVEIL